MFRLANKQMEMQKYFHFFLFLTLADSGGILKK